MHRVSRGLRLWMIAGLAICFALPVPARAQIALDPDHPQVQAVMKVQDAFTPALMAHPDVLGTATGLGDDGALAILVFVNEESPSAAATVGSMSTRLGGVPVRTVATAPFRALKGGGGGGTNHRSIQTPPIQLGTSGGWRGDLANGFCCGGTLGALISVGGQQRILSNYHVFEADIVNGGNGITAQTGSFIIQPGLLDVGCNANNAQNVATLVKSSSLPGSNVDASSANVISGMVRTDGSILAVGVPSSSTVAAAINQAVKKSGRTTGLTRSKVSGLNASISVAYENECAGGAAFTKTFTGQILISNTGSKFLAGGDSGSLLLEDVTTSPRAVGLLFAGSTSLAVANPIGQVLGFFGATMVGN
jgi:hypothetical protein